MLSVNVNFNADTRMMKIDSLSTGGHLGATTGDNKSTALVFNFIDPSGKLEGFTPRVEFEVYLLATDGTTYKPFLELDSENRAILPNTILSAVKCGNLPFQLIFSKMVEEEKQEFYSLNILNLAVTRAIDAVYTPVEKELSFEDALHTVTFDKATSTFTFTQFDGTKIEIAVSEAFVEDHYDVENLFDLITLDKAKSGDTATILSTGVWYKLYGDYSVLDNWKLMSGGLMLNGHPEGHADFYAPVTYGGYNETLLAREESNPPIWAKLSKSVTLTFTESDESVTLDDLYYEDNHSKIECSFRTQSGERVILPYSLEFDEDNNVTGISVSSKMGIPIIMTITVIPE